MQAERTEGHPSLADRARRYGGLKLVVPLVAFLVVYASWQVLRFGGTAHKAAIGDAAFWPVNLAAVVLCWRVARRRDFHPALRRAWLLIGWGLLSYLAGDILQFVYEVVLHESPYPSFADACYLAFYPLVLAGILQLPHPRRTRQALSRMLTDATIVLLGAGTVVWYVLLGPTATAGGERALQLAFSVAYPVGDLVLLFGLTTLVFRGVAGVSRGAMNLFCLGLAFFVAADLVYGHLALENAYQGGDPVDALWMVALAAIVVGAKVQLDDAAALGTASTAPRPTRGQALLPYAAVATAFALLISANVTANAFKLGVLVLVSILTALVVVRLHWLSVEHRRQGRYFRSIVENVSDNIVTIDALGSITYLSPSMERLLGLDADEVLESSLAGALGLSGTKADGLAGVLGELAVHPGEGISLELDVDSADSGCRRLVGYATNLLDDPSVRGTVIVFHDVTERVALESELRHQALHDALTGLPNRALIYDRLAQLLAGARRGGSAVAVLFVDLDNFKDVNDSLGHDHGDELLKAVAARLSTVARGEDTVGRLGGDEFVVLARARVGTDTPELLAQRILDVLEQPFELDGAATSRLFVRASIGIAIGTGKRPDELLRDADLALYRAKAAGRNRLVVFEPEMHRLADERLQRENDLREALERGEFFVVYQPIIDLAHLEFGGVEALLRWRRPNEGVVAPSEFIPLLEQSGLIIEVGKWVLDEACAQGATWADAGDALSVSVNVSAHQIASGRLVDDVREALARSGFDASRLVIEVTESALMEDADGAALVLAELRSLGVRLAVDDFGTGYSSLSYLKQFPIDVLKIDRSFIAEIATSKEAATLVHMLVSLGSQLGLETVAEGIENEREYDSLRAEACDAGQGFWFARPMAADEVAAFAASFVAGDLRVPGRAVAP